MGVLLSKSVDANMATDLSGLNGIFSGFLECLMSTAADCVYPNGSEVKGFVAQSHSKIRSFRV